MANIRTIDYQGFKAASGSYGPTGWMLWSGSVAECTSSGGADTVYTGIGFEFVGSSESYMRFSHIAGTESEIDIRANKFFVGTPTTQFISGSGNLIEISSSNFHLGPAGDVVMQGKITANEGAIGGFTIGASTLTATDFQLDTTAKRITLGTGTDIFVADADEGIQLGHGTFASAPFSVTKAGSLKAVAGEIAAFTISSDTLGTTGYSGTSSGVALKAGATPSIVVRKNASDYIEQKYTSDTDWGLAGYNAGSSIFQLGSTNQIAGWKFDTTKIISNLGANSPLSPGIVISSNGTIETDPFISGLTANATGWQIRADGRAEFENAVIRGTLSTAVFEKDTISVVGGQVMVANAAKIDTTNPRYIDYPYLTNIYGSPINYSGEEMLPNQTFSKFNGSAVYRDSDFTGNNAHASDLWFKLVTPASGHNQTFRISHVMATDATKQYRLTFYIDPGTMSNPLQFGLIRATGYTSGGVYNGTTNSFNGSAFISNNTRYNCSPGLNTFIFNGDAAAVGGHKFFLKNVSTSADSYAYTRDWHVTETSQSLTVDNAGGFTAGEIVVAKSTDQGPDGREGFVREYMRIQSASLGAVETPASGSLNLSSTTISSGTVLQVTASKNYTFTGVASATADVVANNDYKFLVGTNKADSIRNIKNKVMEEVLDMFVMVTGSAVGANDQLHFLSHGVGTDGNAYGAQIGSTTVSLSGAINRVKPTLVVERNLDALVSGNGRGFAIERIKDGQSVASQGKAGTGYILLNAQPTDDNSPYIDIVERQNSSIGSQQHTADSQHSVFGDVKTVVRVGDLQGITDNSFSDGVSGYGIYTENGYFKGKIEVTNPDGASMEHNFGGPSGSVVPTTLLVDAGQVTGSQWYQTTTTRHVVKNGGLQMSSSATGWISELRSKQIFNRADDHTFQSDFTMIAVGSNQMMIGWGDTATPSGTNSGNYSNSAHIIFLEGSSIKIFEGNHPMNGGNAILSGISANDKFRAIIKPHTDSKGALYKLFKHPNLTSPVATYDSVLEANARQDLILDAGVWAKRTNSDRTFIDSIIVLPPGAMTTTIEGGRISTGKIQSNNLSSTAGSEFDLDDGTFRLGGDSTNAKLKFESGVLTVKGQIQIEAGSTFGGNTIASLSTLTISANTNIFAFDDASDTTPTPTTAQFTVQQSNQSDNLVVGDISVTNGTISNFSHTQVTAAGTGNATFTVTPNGTYPVSVTVTNDGLSDTLSLQRIDGGAGGGTGPQGPAGDNGDDAVNTASVYAYKRFAPGATIDQPITSRTWTFANGSFGNNNLGNGWTATAIPSGTDDLYLCTAIASAEATTDAVAGGDWSTAQLFASQGIPGEPAFTFAFPYDNRDNTAGANGQGKYTFQDTFDSGSAYNGSGSPASVTTDFSSVQALQIYKQDVDGIDHSTYFSALVLGDSLTYYVTADRWYHYTITSIDSTPPSNRFNFGLTFVSENVNVAESLIPNTAGTDVNFRFQKAVDGTNGTNGVSTAVVYAYKRASSAPSNKPSTDRTWTFSSATFDDNDLGNGYTALVPAGTDDLYTCTAVASAIVTTDVVDAPGDWTSPQLLAANGLPGSAAKTVTVVSDSAIFVKDVNGDLSPSSITITANGQNLTQTPAPGWTTSSGTLTSTSATTAGGSATVTSANFVDGMVVTFTSQAADGTLTDSVTLREVEVGSNALQVHIENEAHVLPASTAGVVSDYAGSGTKISVFEGATQLDFDGTGNANGHWGVAATQVPSSTITIGTITDSTNDAIVGPHSAMSNATDSVVITYTISGKRLNGTIFSFVKTQSISKSKAGTQGDQGIQGNPGTPGNPGVNNQDFAFLSDSISTLATPLAEGLLLASDIMGYHGDIDLGGSAGTNASLSDFSTYMDNSGNFYLGGTSGALVWDNANANLVVAGKITVTNPTDFADPNAAGPNFPTENLLAYYPLDRLHAQDANGDNVVMILDEAYNPNRGQTTSTVGGLGSVPYHSDDVSSGNPVLTTQGFTAGGAGDFAPGSPLTSAMRFDGTDDRVKINSLAGATYDSMDISVSFWVFHSGGNDECVFHLSDGGQNDLNLFLNAGSVNNQIKIHVQGTAYSHTSSKEMTNTWTHIAFTLQNGLLDTSILKLYIDGNLANTTTSVQDTGAFGDIDEAVIGLDLDGANFGSPGNFFEGALGQLRFYDSVLTQANVTALYHNADGQNTRKFISFKDDFGGQDGITKAATTVDTNTWKALGNTAGVEQVDGCLKIQTNTNGWNTSVRSKKVFTRKDCDTLVVDITLLTIGTADPDEPRMMIGWGGVGANNPHSYTSNEHAVYFTRNNIQIYEDSTPKGTILSTAVAANDKFRVEMTPNKDSGFHGRIYKFPDLETTVCTWNTHGNTSNTGTKLDVGVWTYVNSNTFKIDQMYVESIGAGAATIIKGDSITTGVLRSTNLSTTAGSELDLDAGTIKLGGTTDPGFDVTSAGNVTATNFSTKSVTVTASNYGQYTKAVSGGVKLVFDGLSADTAGGLTVMHMVISYDVGLIKGFIVPAGLTSGLETEVTVDCNVAGLQYDEASVTRRQDAVR
mgnify:CR=1 FL=1